jgi:hypothetical protein
VIAGVVVVVGGAAVHDGSPVLNHLRIQ